LNLSSGFIKRPITTALLMVAVVVLGIISYVLLPVAALPNIDTATIQVTAQMPGADPQTMASSVATQLERQFSQIPDLSQMTSSSGTGFTSITLQFDRSRTVDSAAIDVQAAINATQSQLPISLLRSPIYRKTNPADTPILLVSMTSDVRLETLLAASPMRRAFGRLGERTLIAWDRTEYFCSQKLGCPNCLTRKRSNGKTENYHCLLSATVVSPGHSKVVPLMPEFVATQDGAEKQDCERNAVKRWFNNHHGRIPTLRPVFLGDDLFACQPVAKMGSSSKSSDWRIVQGPSRLFTSSGGIVKVVRDSRRTSQEGKTT
jgi:hypothetical protein